MVSLVAVAAAALLLWTGDAPDAGRTANDPPASAVGPVRSALEKAELPWYDAATGRVKPVLPRPDLGAGPWKRVVDWLRSIRDTVAGWFRRMNRWGVPGVGRLGDVVAAGLAVLLLAVVIVGLLALLRRYRPAALEPGEDLATASGRARRIEGLPAGVRLDSGDPWVRAQALRAQGDYAGAVVHLFAHQLLALERTRHLRFVPGRTGRQLVRSVVDRGLRGAVEPTLRLFEAVYYGQRAPSAEAFESVWTQAEAFERTLAGQVGGNG